MKLLISILCITLFTSSYSQNDGFNKLKNIGFTPKSIYKTPVYNQPNTTAKLLGYYHHFRYTYLVVLAEKDDWVKIKFLNKKDSVEHGYVQKNKLIVDEYHLRDYQVSIVPQYWKNYNKEFYIITKNQSEKVIYDSLKVFNLHHGERFMKLPYQSGLKGANNIIRFQSYRESCPGLTSNEYIISTDSNKLISLIKETSTGEIGYQTEIIYQPVKFTNGNIKLLAFGYEGQIINPETGEFLAYKNPEKFKIPLDQLVIKVTEFGDPVIVNDDYVMLDEYEYKLKHSSKTEVYKWNGESLKKIPIK